MAALDNQPMSPNLLNPTGFGFSVKRLPNVSFRTQRANIPGISIPTIVIPNARQRRPVPGSQIDYNPLVVQFTVDEDLANFMELFSWMMALAEAKNDEGYTALAAQPLWSANGLTSEASMIITDAKKNPNWEVNFSRAWPVTMSDIYLEISVDSIQYSKCEVTFEYLNYSMSRVKSGFISPPI